MSAKQSYNFLGYRMPFQSLRVTSRLFTNLEQHSEGKCTWLSWYFNYFEKKMSYPSLSSVLRSPQFLPACLQKAWTTFTSSLYLNQQCPAGLRR